MAGPGVSWSDDSVNTHQTPALGAKTRCDWFECPVASLKRPPIVEPIFTGAGVAPPPAATTLMVTKAVVDATLTWSVGVNVAVSFCPYPGDIPVPGTGE